MYGSNSWDLFSPECQKLYRSYNITLRTVNGIPRTTHKYLLESLTGYPHLFVQLLSRYVTFSKSLLKSNSFPVRFLARVCLSDMRSVLGRTIAQLAKMLKKPNDIDLLYAYEVKKIIKYAELPQSEEWRIGLIRDMKNILNNEIYLGLNHSEATRILEFGCTS